MDDAQLDILAIFTEAVACETPQQREKFLADACQDNSVARQRVETLLRAHLDAGNFLGGDAGEPGATIDHPLTEKPGTQIGPYKLREQIGEGGFGVVFVAEQTKPVRRKVALKVIKPGMDTKEVIARFEAERQALALMDHPNVARVLDAGTTESGRPYFAMELVQGVPITEFCDKQKLSTKERLHLVVDVCRAVQHAHRKGIIHRDIKPSNVMVTMHDHRPVAKVIDFGVAKAIGSSLTEKTIYTAYGQMVGTPMYMSPEQAQMSGLDVDTRSDVYSLGVLLYELLTGTPPFDKETLHTAGFDEMRRIILEEEPQRPSIRVSTLRAEQLSTTSDQRKIDAGRLRQSLQGELDWIVMKALEKDRSRRYESASSLADDVKRYLEDDAVQACPPTMAYRLSKFARRHKAAIGVSAAMVVLLLGGIAATAWQAVRATSEMNRAVAAETLAEQRLKESEEARARSDKDREAAVAAQRKAEASRDEAEAVARFLSDIFKSPRPESEGGGRNVRVVDLLDGAAKRLEGTENISPDRIAGLQRDLALTYKFLGLRKQAVELQEKVARHYLDTRGPEERATVVSKMDLANSYCALGRLEEALELHMEVLESSRRALGPRQLHTIQAMGNLATSYEKVGEQEKALELREEAFRLSNEEFGREHTETYYAMTNLTRSYIWAGRQDEALALREEALPLSHRVFPPRHPERLKAKLYLADSYELDGRVDEALQMREEVLVNIRETRPPKHPGTLYAIRSLARSYAAAGRQDEARALRDEANRLSADEPPEASPEAPTADSKD